MDELMQLLEIADIPFVAFLCFAVMQLWRRLNQFIDAWVSYLQKRAEAGEVAAQRALQSSTAIPIQRTNGDAK